MRIAVCGSMAFIDEMEALATALRAHGAEVVTPVREEASPPAGALSGEALVLAKRAYINGHLEAIRQSDLVLIANFEKAATPGYIGPNTLVEAAFAKALGKPTAFLHRPGPQPCQLEALAMMATCLDGDVAALVSDL